MSNRQLNQVVPFLIIVFNISDQKLLNNKFRLHQKRLRSFPNLQHLTHPPPTPTIFPNNQTPHTAEYVTPSEVNIVNVVYR